MSVPFNLFSAEKIGNRLEIGSLCGETLVRSLSKRISGSAVLLTDTGRFEGDDLQCITFKITERAACAEFVASDRRIKLVSSWTWDPPTGVVSRRDFLENIASRDVTVFRSLSRIALPSGNHELYSQKSYWSRESQGKWEPLHAGEVVLRHVWGRTAHGATPYVCARNSKTLRGIVLHVVPCGNWVIRVAPVASFNNPPFAVIEAGLSDENLRMTIRPGEKIELPEIIYQSLTDGDPLKVAPRLQKYLLKTLDKDTRMFAPVVYNTWFDHSEILDVQRLRRQLKAAKEVGCEVMTIDAGWYGSGSPNWAVQTGDWREKKKAAFKGKMSSFADEVRKTGLGFGIWLEPERIGVEAPVFKEHPEWIVNQGNTGRLNLENPAAYAWIKSEIKRLIAEYRLVWIKWDFNLDCDCDQTGMELSGYVRKLYQLVRELKSEHPEVFWEGCASGALRLDLATARLFDNHFLSDTVNPVDTIRILQGTALRTLPGRLGRWAVLRSPGSVLPLYRATTENSPPTLLVPSGAIWEPAETADLGFAMLAQMIGMLGFSGDIAQLPASINNQIRKYVAFYKKWRRLIVSSVVHCLTPVESINDREGWAVFQVQDPASTTSILFVYKLGLEGGQEPLWLLKDLVSGAKYRVTRGVSGKKAVPFRMSGSELMEIGVQSGVSIDTGRKCLADVVCVERDRAP